MRGRREKGRDKETKCRGKRVDELVLFSIFGSCVCMVNSCVVKINLDWLAAVVEYFHRFISFCCGCSRRRICGCGCWRCCYRGSCRLCCRHCCGCGCGCGCRCCCCWHRGWNQRRLLALPVTQASKRCPRDGMLCWYQPSCASPGRFDPLCCHHVVCRVKIFLITPTIFQQVRSTLHPTIAWLWLRRHPYRHGPAIPCVCVRLNTIVVPRIITRQSIPKGREKK